MEERGGRCASARKRVRRAGSSSSDEDDAGASRRNRQRDLPEPAHKGKLDEGKLEGMTVSGCCMHLPLQSAAVSASLRETLTREPQCGGGFAAHQAVEMWRSAGDQLSVPRHFGVERFRLPHGTVWAPLPRTLDNSCGSGSSDGTGLTSMARWRFHGHLNALQVKAFDACMDSFDRHRGGILSLFCGAGKTVCALALAAALRRKTLVIVGKTFLCDQWEQRVRQFLPAARLGQIRQDTVDVAGKDIVVAMLQSLVARGEAYPTHDFGLVVVDECHHMCARSFSRALFTIGAPCARPCAHSKTSSAGRIAGVREGGASDVCLLGLSATPQRKDGLTECLHWWFGPTAFAAERPASLMLGAQVHVRSFCGSEARLPRCGFAEEVSALADNAERNGLICTEVRRAWNAGRRILLLSDRRQHLEALKKILCSRQMASSQAAAGPCIPHADVAFHVGGMKGPALEAAARCPVLLATYGMCCEGLDIAGLNTLILATPRKDITQSVGRILREQMNGDLGPANGAAMAPLVVDVVDLGASARLNRLAMARCRQFCAAGFTVCMCGAPDAIAGAALVLDDAQRCHKAEEAGQSAAEGEHEDGCDEDAGLEQMVGRLGSGNAEAGCKLCSIGAYGGRDGLPNDDASRGSDPSMSRIACASSSEDDHGLDGMDLSRREVSRQALVRERNRRGRCPAEAARTVCPTKSETGEEDVGAALLLDISGLGYRAGCVSGSTFQGLPSSNFSGVGRIVGGVEHSSRTGRRRGRGSLAVGGASNYLRGRTPAPTAAAPSAVVACTADVGDMSGTQKTGQDLVGTSSESGSRKLCGKCGEAFSVFFGHRCRD